MVARKKNNKETYMAGLANPNWESQKFSQNKTIYVLAVCRWKAGQVQSSGSFPEQSTAMVAGAV